MEPVVLTYVCFFQHAPGKTERQEKIRAVAKQRIFLNNSQIVYRFS